MSTDKRNSAIFINGGAGRVIASIPALEKFQEENPDNDFVIVCEGGTDFFKGHKSLYARVYDHWHKGLFQDKLKERELVTPEPYRVWEYYNQKCSIAQAYDIAINNKGLRTLQKPKITLNKEEMIFGKKLVDEVKEKTKKDKVVVFQPFGRTTQHENGMISDFSGRSFEAENSVSIVKKLSKKFGVIHMAEFGIDFAKHGIKDAVASPMGADLRHWCGIISNADYFLGCDSSGQHMVHALDKKCTVVIGSTFPINVSYPDDENFDILDMGEGARTYSPIRVTTDEYADRTNDGVMAMNDKVESIIIESVSNGLAGKERIGHKYKEE
jgi:ADP-heptose:LPS heptosyltransferase|tara:strand:+ start:683 stop:1660 length:978 start_codon:yes stop_codon:yes gene_type:complete